MAFKKGDPNTKLGGRKPGTKNKSNRLTDEQRKQLAAAAGGITPLEFACSVLRDETSTMKDKQWACELLMPYMHRKLPTAVDVSTNAVVTTVSAEGLAALPADELDKLVQAVLKITETMTVGAA